MYLELRIYLKLALPRGRTASTTGTMGGEENRQHHNTTNNHGDHKGAARISSATDLQKGGGPIPWGCGGDQQRFRREFRGCPENDFPFGP